MEIAIVVPNRSECGRHVQTDRLIGFFGECGEGLRRCHRDGEDQARRTTAPHGTYRHLHGRSGSNAVIDNDGCAPGDFLWRTAGAVGPSPPFDLVELAARNRARIWNWFKRAIGKC
jgi:hypothetical protein